MIRLHTRVADDIREACTHDGVLDRQQEAEMRAESPEYANEVRGFYDEEIDPADYDDQFPELEREMDGDTEDEGGEPDSREDFGWDGGFEE